MLHDDTIGARPRMVDVRPEHNVRLLDRTDGDDIVWLDRKLQQEALEAARLETMFSALRPRPGRLITTRPEVAALSTSHRMASGLHIPDQAIRSLREFGLRCEILRISFDDVAMLDEQGVYEGSTVIVPEYAGTPLWLGGETPWWIVSIGDLMCVIQRDDRDGEHAGGADCD